LLLERLGGEGPGLFIAPVTSAEIVLGAYQRAASALRMDQVTARAVPVTRRASGGPAVWIGPGTVHVLLALPRPDALVAGNAAQLANRYVRPLLAALSRLLPGERARAHFFGRDWVTVAHRPASWIGWAHQASTGRSIVEAFVALSHPFALPAQLDGYPARAADAYLGKAPSTVAEAAGRSFDVNEVMEAIGDAYERAYPGRIERRTAGDEELRVAAGDVRPPFDALEEAAIGFVGAGAAQGRLELGGDFFASLDLLPELERAFAGLAPEAAAAWDAALGATLEGGGFALEGLRDRTALCRVARAAWIASRSATG
jgi:lipoate-protein ligase A